MEKINKMRIKKHPILKFNSGNKVQFIFDGKNYDGIEGEPIACALHAAGVKVLGHSHNKNRPRGLYCAIGNCSSCLATVNGKPNIRICVTKLEDGMIIEKQKGRGELKV